MDGGVQSGGYRRGKGMSWLLKVGSRAGERNSWLGTSACCALCPNGALRRGRLLPRGIQHTEVAGAHQGEFCRWKHGFSFPWETRSGGGIGSDDAAQPIAPRECWEWWRDKSQEDLNTQGGRAVPNPATAQDSSSVSALQGWPACEQDQRRQLNVALL